MENTNWDSLLPDGIYAINTSVQSTTDVTPFEMLYGYPPVQRIDNEFEWHPERPESHKKFMARKAKNQSTKSCGRKN